MRLKGIRRSKNIVDQRGQRASAGRRMRMPRMGRTRGAGGRIRAGGKSGGIGLVGIIAVLAIAYFAGIDVTPILQDQLGPQTQQGAPRELTEQEKQAGDFTAAVLATTEDVWTRQFEAQVGKAYTPPQLVLFSEVTRSACGGASGATGPFYCPADRRAYMDTTFFATLRTRLGAGGDFAAAYVIAHEVAHHVQNELGILSQANAERARVSKTEANAISVRIELQADCFSGIWASKVQDLLDPGDLEEALNAARKIGDDHLQRSAGRVPNPHSFTHGTSAQREAWFKRGWDSGDMNACDTWSARRL